jgi:hypothetical protein
MNVESGVQAEQETAAPAGARRIRVVAATPTAAESSPALGTNVRAAPALPASRNAATNVFLRAGAAETAIARETTPVTITRVPRAVRVAFRPVEVAAFEQALAAITRTAPPARNARMASARTRALARTRRASADHWGAARDGAESAIPRRKDRVFRTRCWRPAMRMEPPWRSQPADSSAASPGRLRTSRAAAAPPASCAAPTPTATPVSTLPAIGRSLGRLAIRGSA